MTPMIPALTAAGMIKVVLTLLTTFHLVSDTSSTYQVISFIGDVTFYFMPFLIAANAAKIFRVNQSLALFIAGVYSESCICQYGSWRCGNYFVWAAGYKGNLFLFCNSGYSDGMDHTLH